MGVSGAGEGGTRTLTPAPLLLNAIKGKIQGVAENDGLKARPE